MDLKILNQLRPETAKSHNMQSMSGADSLFNSMDIGKIFECLEKDYRTIVIATVMAFPVAYVDCWKLSTAFCGYDAFPQVLLSLGVAILMVFAGVFHISLIRLITEGRYRWTISYHIIGILYTFILSSIFVAYGAVESLRNFIVLYLCFYAATPSLCVAAALSSQKG